MRGEAVFSTLNHESATRRAALKAHADASKDLSLLGLLAEFDRSVNLQREACEELRGVLDQGAANPANAEALTRFGCSEPDGSPKHRK